MGFKTLFIEEKINKLKYQLERLAKSIIFPISILPIAGLLVGISTFLTNKQNIETYHLTYLLNDKSLIYALLLMLKNGGELIFTILPLLFAMGVSLGLAKREKGVAVISSMISFVMMHETIHTVLMFQGKISTNGIIHSKVLQSSITSILGIQTLEMGVFGGIICGIMVSYLHNRFYQYQLPEVISFFSGIRFVPIICIFASILLGMIMSGIWPIIQQSIYHLGLIIVKSSYLGTFAYGVIKRLLVPFGLHHIFYLPFWQTGVGGHLMVDGQMIYGGQNIFFAQLASSHTTSFNVNATRYFTGEFIFMIFGLPGAALAIYKNTLKQYQKEIKALLISAVFTCILTGITEPLEFLFVFTPSLFFTHVLLAGSAYMMAHLFHITIGLTFSGGLIDFILFGVMQGQSKTNYLLIFPLGIIYFIFYYGLFSIIIKKYKIQLVGQKPKQKPKQTELNIQYLVQGLGGINNFYDVDACVTRLRMHIHDTSKINESLIKQSGAAGLVVLKQSIQIVYGPRASLFKNQLEEYVETHPQIESVNVELIELLGIVDGEVVDIKESKDEMIANKMLGEGLIIRPKNNHLYSPVKGEIVMVFPTKHALGIRCENGLEILIHIGVNTVLLNGEGFLLQVKVGDQVQPGDLLWMIDLEYIETHATSSEVVVVVTQPSQVTVTPIKGLRTHHDYIGFIRKEDIHV